MERRICVLDFESTGLTAEDEIVEAATVDVTYDEDEGRWARGAMWSSLVNPGRPIPCTAMAIHHITDEMVAGAPELHQVMPHLDPTIPHMSGTTTPELPVYAAHKADFERQFFDPNGAQWICTWRCAVTCWPDAPGFSNQVLRYWLGLKLKPELCARPHRAPDDAYVTAAILVRMLTTGLTVERAIDISSKPVVLPFLTFGMHATKSVGAYHDDADGRHYAVPTSYLEWMLKQKDMDPDAKHTAFVHLNKRREQQ